MPGETLTPLGAEDARILALESGPIRGHTLKVLLVDGAPDAAPLPALRAAIEQRLHDVRRWRQRLVSARCVPSGLAWQDDPSFRIERHVLGVPTDGPVDEEGLRRIVAGIMARPLDRGHPLWAVHVVPRLVDGRWALVWQVHHCLADGLTIVQVGSRLLWTEQPRLPRQERRTTPGAPAQVAAGARLATLAGYRGLVRREFHRVKGLSPLAASVGPERTVAFADCTLDELRTLGRAVGPGVTVNDVLLAVVAGGLRTWLHARHDTGTAMKVQVPVSMHPHLGADDPSGNADSFLFVDLPLGEADPVARVRAVATETRLRKNRHDARAIYALRESLAHVPGPLRRAVQRVVQGPHEYALNVSNVPGPAGPIHVLDRRVAALYSVAEVAPRHALRVAAVSLTGSLYVGLCADPRVVPDLHDLAAGIRRSIDELHEQLAGLQS